MENFFIQALKFAYCVMMVLLLFNLTIFVHEYGHYLLARWRKLKVETFAIWFGPAIWKRRIGDIEYILGSIPLGGYVKLPQLQPDDPIEGKSEIPQEQLPYARPIDRIPTLFAGSFFNFIFAFLIASLLWIVGIPVDKSFTDTTIGYVPEKSAEAAAGLRIGDKIVSINGKAVQDWMDIKAETALATTSILDVLVLRDHKTDVLRFQPPKNILGMRELQSESRQGVVVGRVIDGSPASRAGLKIDDRILSIDSIELLSPDHLATIIAPRISKECAIVLDRNGNRMTLRVTPVLDPDARRGRIGIGFKIAEADTVLIHPNPIKQITDVLLRMTQIINAIFHHKETGIGVKDLAGPIGIVDQLYQMVAVDIRHALYFLVLLNVNLAILNLLPLPVLDGGHIMFTLLEWIRRKPLNHKLMEAIQTTFVILLLAFVVYVSFNDVKRWRLTHGFGPKPEAGPASQNQAPNNTIERK